MVCVIQVYWQLVSRIRMELQFRPDPARKLSANLYDIYHCCVHWNTPDDGQRNCPKHVEFYSKNKFEKLVHLVGFIIRICYKPSMNVLLMWTDQNLKNALQFKFRNNVELSTCSGGNFKTCCQQSVAQYCWRNGKWISCPKNQIHCCVESFNLLLWSYWLLFD